MYSSTTFQPTFDLSSTHLSPSDIEFDRCLSTANYQQQQQQQQQRHDSIDYSRRPSYFTGLLGTNNNSEASYSDHEQQTPSPFNSYEDYQYHHPLDNSNKRRPSTLVELPHLAYQQQQQQFSTVINHSWLQQQQQQQQQNVSSSPPSRCHSSPMIYANPAVDMYSPQTYLNTQYHNSYHPLCAPVVDSTMLVPSHHGISSSHAGTVTTADAIYRERAASSSSSSSDSALSLSPPSTPAAAVAAAAATRRISKANNLNKSPLKPTRSRGRRVSNSPSIAGQKVFTCKHDNCGKVFKRSEHLKRHVRSIHTLEKPFECPYQTCSKRFSRSDNLNQHIRIHRHTGKDKNTSSSTAVSSNNRSSSFSNYMPTY
ncbi:hypothetical protein BD770DRAFT_441951 [Pilaira anomala]|nr:hypothetical protein BD770DRAFT_441951 [Pilaira anomala]